jgi:gluconolactonase
MAVNAPSLERIVEVDAHEGPVYVADENALYFTTLPRELRVDVKRLDLASAEVKTVRADANMANGMALAPDGRLLVCEQGTFEAPARISALDPATGRTETVVDAWRGRPFNSPNDLVVKLDGTIWFTDPSYGHLQGFRPEPQVADAVYRYDPAADSVDVVADGFDKPNGLAFSSDESLLYVSDNGAPHHLLGFEVGRDGSLGEPRRVFVGTPEHPDGVKVDHDGRIYLSASTGLQIVDPSGELVGEIDLPGAVNFTFGAGVLFITTDTAIWAAKGA